MTLKIAKPITIIGAILIVFGLIFQSQGRGQIGPESSFMYYSKDWIYYGIGIVIIGIVTCGVGVFLLRR
jgi:hypothetical protein